MPTIGSSDHKMRGDCWTHSPSPALGNGIFDRNGIAPGSVSTGGFTPPDPGGVFPKGQMGGEILDKLERVFLGGDGSNPPQIWADDSAYAGIAASS